MQYTSRGFSMEKWLARGREENQPILQTEKGVPWRPAWAASPQQCPRIPGRQFAEATRCTDAGRGPGNHSRADTGRRALLLPLGMESHCILETEGSVQRALTEESPPLRRVRWECTQVGAALTLRSLLPADGLASRFSLLAEPNQNKE